MEVSTVVNMKPEDAQYINHKLAVPLDIDATNVKHLGIIQISYELNIEAQLEGYRKKVDLKIPIIIGTVAIKGIDVDLNSNVTNF